MPKAMPCMAAAMIPCRFGILMWIHPIMLCYGPGLASRMDCNASWRVTSPSKNCRAIPTSFREPAERDDTQRHDPPSQAEIAGSASRIPSKLSQPGGRSPALLALRGHDPAPRFLRDLVPRAGPRCHGRQDADGHFRRADEKPASGQGADASVDEDRE